MAKRTMHNKKEKSKKEIKKENRRKEFYIKILLFTGLVLVYFMYFVLNKPGSKILYFDTSLDYKIPFIPFFIIFYIIVYFLLIYGTMLYSLFFEKTRFKILAISVILTNLISFSIYYFFQSGVMRYPVIGNDIFSWLVLQLYTSAAPFNAFPSGHAYHSIICLIHWFKSRTVARWKTTVLVSIAIILISTVVIKQHFILDIIAGVLLGSAVYFFVESLFKKYGNYEIINGRKV